MMDAKTMLAGWQRRTAEEALAEVDRELAVRLKCFPRWVDEGRINAVDGKDRLQRLRQASEMFGKLLHAEESEVMALWREYSKSCAKADESSEINSDSELEPRTPF